MTTITITLPDDLAKRAEERGLLSPAAIESYVRDRLEEEAMRDQTGRASAAADFDPCLEGLVNPAAFRRGKIIGDIIGPFHEAWGEAR